MSKDLMEEIVYVGSININIYKSISKDIDSDKVIITKERINHINTRHNNDYKIYSSYIADILKSPDFILESNKPHTAFILKYFIKNNKKFQLILRIHTKNDRPKYENSIITLLKISEKKWNKYLRNKKILYKHE